jgi:hypothetical protein
MAVWAWCQQCMVEYSWVLFVHLAFIFVARHAYFCYGFGLFYIVVWSAEQNV